MVLRSATFRGNTADTSGGAISLLDTINTVSFMDLTFEENIAMVGGSLYTYSLAHLMIETSQGRDSVFRNNKAIAGGAIYLFPNRQSQNTFKVKL